MLAELDITADRHDLRPAAARLAQAVDRVAAAERAAAWQDGLDLLAAAAGLKPVALLGRGCIDAAWLAEAQAWAGAQHLATLTGASWHPAPDTASLPAWYRAATAARRGRDRALHVWRDAAAGAGVRRLCATGAAAPADEAALLGYPVCCVVQHHAQVHAVERLTAALVARLAPDDPVRQHRLIAAGVTPTPRTEADWRQLAAATAIDPQPWTSVNRCAACARDPDGPAGRLGRRFQALARTFGYPPLAAVQ